MAINSEPTNQPQSRTETDRLRKAWEDGLASGPFDDFDIEAIKEKARARLAGSPGPDQCR
jgi:Arc/MetJ-type ribon-helix-helix transcriptional regulator